MPERITATRQFGRTVVVDTYHQIVRESPKFMDETVGTIARMALHRALKEVEPDVTIVQGIALQAALREIKDITLGVEEAPNHETG